MGWADPWKEPEADPAALHAELDGCKAEIAKLRGALAAAREELTHWGWGDFHWGPQPQEKRVVDAIAAIDEALRR